MTPALKAMVEAMAAEIQSQDCRLIRDGNTLDSGYDGAQFDLEKVARAGLAALNYSDTHKPAFIATADRHEIRPLVLISAYSELLERMREQ